ncbi:MULTISPECIES: ABC transporter ATP-binding protein [Halobacterium]|uniref:ABC transporter ATP-binding protein n=1 Tax=Halobacterium TaxID=2239 RepID=UPI00073F2295|nr:ABC transporter ATP-binding protein [Halobacterium sp. CBA1132]MCG1002076.1 ABC transporter ATP-binding protein [Halobacterium noricense]
MSDPLLEVEDLQKYYYEQDSLLDTVLRRDPTAVRAVDGVSFDVNEGETLGLVGESGCGKSTTGETVLRLREPTGGTVTFDGDDVSDLSGDDLTAFRKRAGIVFQDPYGSLDPRMTAGEIVREPLDIHDVGTQTDREERVRELLERVGLSADQFDRYPHEFSGGQQQRVGIARALALEPDFLVLDEPVSALDVSVQAQILNLLDDLQEEFGLTYLLIAHDLSVVRHICDRVAVMYLGELVETGRVDDIFERPQHPYTKALLDSVPRPETAEADREIRTLSGDVPSPRDPPSGCRFRTRCPAVIPPDDLDVDQEAFRAIMDIRDRLDRGDLDAADVAAADEWREYVPEDVPSEAADALSDAFASLADGDEADARDRLRETFETVCERDNPALGDGERGAACHLVD